MNAVGICNRALQKVGAKRIVSLDDASVSARACTACYEPVRDALLRSHFWAFAITTAELAADGTAPTWGKANSFTLPSDCLRVFEPYPEYNSMDIDYSVQGRKIYTNLDAPLNIRYIKKVVDPAQHDALFNEALACALAVELCEELTQSNTKKASLKEDFIFAIREARRANAFERRPQQPPTDSFITARR